MTRGRSSKKADQKGVEAIFSPSKAPRQARLIYGGVAACVGIFSILASVTIGQFPQLSGQLVPDSYESLEFASTGVFVLTCGVGSILSGLQSLHSPNSATTIGDNASSPFPSGRAAEDLSPPSYRLWSPNLRLTLLAFLQGAILVSLYSGLVEEYQSNPTMQAWVYSFLNDAQYLLTWGAVLVSSFLVGILVVYCLVSTDLVE